jgi:2-amino-4-hydroxy-6-hydroxymethyldihydropteridine diphosphokinase
MAHAIRAFVAIGSNLGDRHAIIEQAVAALAAAPGIQLICLSKLHEYAAVGGPPDSPPFLNAAAELSTTLSAPALLRHLLAVEHQLGRQRRLKWEPRIIDLDLLLYGFSIIATQDLVIPHPLMHERRFVLEPLAEIAPDALHPTLQMTAGGLLDALDRATARPPQR